jgi:hypothetical protein
MLFLFERVWLSMPLILRSDDAVFPIRYLSLVYHPSAVLIIWRSGS